MNNKTCIAIGMGIVASVIASFLLFAIAFNTLPSHRLDMTSPEP